MKIIIIVDDTYLDPKVLVDNIKSRQPHIHTRIYFDMMLAHEITGEKLSSNLVTFHST